MPIDTANITQGRRTSVLWAKDFDWITAEGTPNTLISTVDTDVVRREVSTLGATGALMNADGDTVTALWTLPEDADYAKPVYVRVLWATESVTSADTVLWRLFYKLISLDNSALSATIDTALNTVIATDTVGSTTAGTARATAWGKINPGNITNVNCFLQLKLEMQTKAVGLSENLYALALQFSYQPLVKTAGRGRVLVAPT
jgi:hypothetical protein